MKRKGRKMEKMIVDGGRSDFKREKERRKRNYTLNCNERWKSSPFLSF